MFKYDKETGLFSRKLTDGSYKSVGKKTKDRYMKIGIDKKQYLLHRLAWLYVYGEMPKNELDHINHNRYDNRISNLRETNRSENCQNMSKSKANTSGVTGVNWHKHGERWVARIHVDKKRVELGAFVNYSDAVNARKNAEVLYGYHKNHGS